MSMWRFISRIWLKDLLHCSQLCCFFPLWVSICLFSSLDCFAEYLHWLQMNGFSPVWMSMWVFRFPARLNDLRHCTQMCSFSPLCVSMWLFRLVDLFDEKLHWLHLKGTFSICIGRIFSCPMRPALEHDTWVILDDLCLVPTPTYHWWLVKETQALYFAENKYFPFLRGSPYIK